MAVTKQTYTATATWTPEQLADLFRDAFIDAGLMTAWHAEFATSSNRVRVLKIEHDNTKAFGSTFYYFVFRIGSPQLTSPGVSIASGWDTSTNLPTGTQFLDYHILPASVVDDDDATILPASSVFSTSNISLDRFTSAGDTKQSWFVLRQGITISSPFAFLHKNTVLHPWLDLDKGIVNGLVTIDASVNNRQGFVNFQLEENIRRCLLTGTALRGETETGSSGSTIFHNIAFRTHCYTGLGSQADSTFLNESSSSIGGAVILPVAKSSANPAFTADYVPICSSLPWSPFTPTLLANDFGIYMHYADNTIVHGDKFIVEAGVNEWEVLRFANNIVVVDGASPAFLARVV
jgi:hypothetical protein